MGVTYATVDAAADGGLLHTASQRRFAAFATTATFAGVLVLLCAAPAIVVATTATADVRFAGLDEAVTAKDDGARAQCLRAARRSDYVVAFLGIGAPVQHLQLLLRLDEVVASPAEALYVFTSRLLKSQTIACDSASADSTLVAACTDVALVYDGADEQRHLRTSFRFSNAEVADSRQTRAYELGLDGELRLSLGHTVWLTTTHLCWAEHGAFPPAAGGAEDAVLPLARVFGPDGTSAHWLSSAVANVAVFEPFADTPIAEAFHDATVGCYQNELERVRIFPLAAYNEYAEWLVLGAQFTFEYSTQVLADRRAVVEVGSECASLLAENSSSLERAGAMYALDCGLQSYQHPCQTNPAVPFRRVADYKLRFDIDRDGAEIQLRAEKTRLLARLPRLLPFDESLLAALGRLVVLLITAAVVFVRGTQRSTDSMWLLASVIDRIRAETVDPSLLLEQKIMDVVFDAVITLAALVARIVVLVYAWGDLTSSEHGVAAVFEVVGVVASAVHFALRYPPVMKLDLVHGAPPVAKLGGPMGSVDVTAAVLLSFSEPPLLSTDDGRFAAVGRLLIALLISVSVLPRCLFAATTCAMGASTVTNHPGYHARDPATGKAAGQQGYAELLTAATVLWVVQGVCSAGGLAALFVQPAAYAMTRMLRGSTAVIGYALLSGTIAAGLPTITKTTLRALEHASADHDALHRS